MEQICSFGPPTGDWIKNLKSKKRQTKSTLPTDAKERKQIPIYSGFIAYFPAAIAAVASHSFVSNEQHNPGEPLHWAREKSTDQLDALARHLTELTEADTLNEEIELLKAIVWRAAAQLQLKCEEKDNAN